MMLDNNTKEQESETNDEQGSDEMGGNIENLNGSHKRQNHNNGSSQKSWAMLLAASIVISVFAGGVGGFLASEVSTKGLRQTVENLINPSTKALLNGSSVTKINNGGTVSVVDEESAVINVVDTASPAVVSIIVTKDVPRLDENALNPFFNDPFFNPFGFRPQTQGEQETERREIGGGTGFVVSSDGYIITNRHVVDDQEADYTVVMNNGDRFDAQVLARDTLIDIAVIKVDQANLPTIELGDSESLKIGQSVVAIGNSLGEFRNTVSKGIISGLKRSVNAGDEFGRTELLEEVIQTDAAINPGNSGGPLLNLVGQAVGMNVAMAQGAENIGFAIPINDVKNIYQSVKTQGKIVRPYLGVRYMLINEQIQAANSLPYDNGALIVRGDSPGELAVVPGGPAAKAGLSENDIILEVNGDRITLENDLANVIKKLDVGEQVSMKIWSKGEERTVTVTLEEAS